MKLFELEHTEIEGDNKEILTEALLKSEIKRTANQDFNRVELLRFLLALPAGNVLTLTSLDSDCGLRVTVTEIEERH